MFTSFRFWLICSFIVILIVCSLAFVFFLRSANESEKIEDVYVTLKTIHISLLEINKMKNELSNESSLDSNFYVNTNSEFETKLSGLQSSVRRQLNQLLLSQVCVQNNLLPSIEKINSNFEASKTVYSKLIHLYKLKGFKDFGVEGLMRDYAHALYSFPEISTQYYCLQLRRHEKDFLLRRDLNYMHKFYGVVNDFVNHINQTQKFSNIEKNKLLNDLYNYNRYFKMLARIESKIGLGSHSGQLFAANELFSFIFSQIQMLDNQLRTINVKKQQELKNTSIILLATLIAILILIIISLTQIISRSIRSIAATFNTYINSGFKLDMVSTHRTNIREFSMINLSFLKMAKEINIFTNFFREKVHQRTLDINAQKEEILKQQQKIEKQYQALVNKNILLKKRKMLLAAKNQDVRDSLRYAKRIQLALQPKISKVKECFSDCFIYTRAKDVVSGDFHLVYKTLKCNGYKEDRTVFIAADCTGHGVPGAIMSVMGINILYKLIKELKYVDPGTILNHLNKDLNKIVRQELGNEDVVVDGMDIAVFSFNEETYILDYTIARFSHFLITDGNIVSLKTERRGIGYTPFDKEESLFKTSSIQLKKGDTLYAFSDGLQDQFGKLTNKKFKKKNIRDIIEANHREPMQLQKKIFKAAFHEWKGELEQTDDVLIAGFRF